LPPRISAVQLRWSVRHHPAPSAAPAARPRSAHRRAPSRRVARRRTSSRTASRSATARAGVSVAGRRKPERVGPDTVQAPRPPCAVHAGAHAGTPGESRREGGYECRGGVGPRGWRGGRGRLRGERGGTERQQGDGEREGTHARGATWRAVEGKAWVERGQPGSAPRPPGTALSTSAEDMQGVWVPAGGAYAPHSY
jgi:hypothetical protein